MLHAYEMRLISPTIRHSTPNNSLNIRPIQSQNSSLYSTQLADSNDISIDRIDLATDYNPIPQS